MYSVPCAIGLLFTVGNAIDSKLVLCALNGDAIRCYLRRWIVRVGVLVLIYHEVLLYRVRNETLKLLRWLYGYVVSAVGMIGIVVGRSRS